MKLLLAEDTRDLNRALTAVLSRNDYEVDAVYDGAAASERLEEETYDVIVLDIMMPKKDGLQVLADLRAQNIMTPVLLLTAKAEIDDKVLGLDSGANYYLTKPFDAKELLAAVRAITRKSAEVDTKLTYGNIVLDRSSFELSSPSGSMRLANKEFQMLEMLMSNPKNIISVDTFMDHIWGYDTDTESNVVWVYISYLRKKLAALDANVKIKATRNAGYSLEIEE